MKKGLLIAAIFAIVASASFAQIAVGVSGALHMDEQPDSGDFLNDFDKLAWYGFFVDLYLGDLGVGLSVNAHQWYDDLLAVDMVNFDVALYAQYHFLGATTFLDPFAEVGFGVVGYDFANEEDDPNDAPIASSAYGYIGFGLGVNLGNLGVFFKFQYNVADDEPMTMEDEFGNPIDIPAFYVYSYRFTLGFKLIL